MSARRWLPPVLWAALLLVLTSIPNPNVSDVSFPGADKLFHGGLYLVLGWLTARAATDAATRPSAPQLVTLLFLVALFGAADEWHQRWIPGRSPDLLDWAADLFGALLGIAAARIRLIRREPIT